MSLLSFFRKFGIIIIALLALFLTRAGLSYLLILIGIGIITPIICGDKKSALITGILYTTLSYMISYPSGLFLKNYMPTISIPISVSSFDVIINLLIGWLIPVLVTIILVGISSFIGQWIADKLNKENVEEIEVDNYGDYYEDDENFIQIEHEELDNYDKKDLLSLSPIQKAKNRRNKEKKW